MPAPPPAIGAFNQACTHGVAYDIPDQFEDVLVRFNERGPESALKQVAAPIMAAVEALCIDTVHMAHSLREVRLGGP